VVRFTGLLSLPAFLVIVAVWVVAWALMGVPVIRRRWPIARGEVYALGVLTVLWALFFSRLLFESGVRVPKGGGDFNAFYYPLAAFAAAQVQSGHFAQWNPYLFAGAPFAADYQTGALYPVNLLVWAFARPFSYSTFEATIIAHVWWASAATYGFARTLGLRRAPAVLAGVTFAYGGFMTAQLGHAPMIAVASWLPAILAALYRGRHGALGWPVLAGAALTLAIFAGHPQIVLYVGITALAYALYLAWAARPIPTVARDSGDRDVVAAASRPQGDARRWHTDPLLRHWAGALARLALFLGVAVGLAAPLLLPAAQLARRSVRAGIGHDAATEYSLHPFTLLQLVLPKVFGDNPTNYFYSNIFSGETWGYAGIVALVLAVVAMLRRGEGQEQGQQGQQGQRWFFAAIGIVALLGALGAFTPVHGWLYTFVPGFGSIRAAGRLLVLFDFAVALLTAYGLEALLAWSGVRVPGSETFAAALRRVRWGLAIAVGALVLFVIPLFYSLVLGRDDPVGRPVIVLDGLNLLVLLLLATAGIVWVAEQRRLPSRALATLTLALVVLDLFSATAGFNPTTDDVLSGYRHEDARSELRSRAATEPPFRVDTDDVADRFQPSLPMLDGVDAVSGAYNPLGLADYAVLRERAQSSRSSALYGLLNVAYVAEPSEKPAPRDWARVFSGDKVTFYQPSRPPLPRAFVVNGAVGVSGPGPAFDRIKAQDFDPAKLVYIQGAVQPTAADPGASPAMVTQPGTETVTVQVQTTGAGYLVLADAYYPGWQATLDGHAVPVLQADLAFRAVYLPDGGPHTVTFHYVSAYWLYGWFVAGVTALVAVAVLLVMVARGRRGRQ